MAKYKIEITNSFKKDYNKMRSRNNFDENEFKTVLELLSNGELLPERYCNHLLEPKSDRYMGMSYKTRLAVNLYKKWEHPCSTTNSHRDSFRFI